MTLQCHLVFCIALMAMIRWRQIGRSRHGVNIKFENSQARSALLCPARRNDVLFVNEVSFSDLYDTIRSKGRYSSNFSGISL